MKCNLVKGLALAVTFTASSYAPAVTAVSCIDKNKNNEIFLQFQPAQMIGVSTTSGILGNGPVSIKEIPCCTRLTGFNKFSFFFQVKNVYGQPIGSVQGSLIGKSAPEFGSIAFYPLSIPRGPGADEYLVSCAIQLGPIPGNSHDPCHNTRLCFN